MSILKCENISVTMSGTQIIKDVSICLNKGEIVSLLGVSGSGKTTLFNILSGIYKPDSGKVLLKDEDITGNPGKISYMLQKDLLLEHYTVLDNVALPLIIKGMKKKQARQKAGEYFPVFGLKGSEMKYPSQLSGGMKQRAALMRTYLSSNGVALLDEPFSALDTITKSAVHMWYLDVMKKIELSTIFVTHDIDEAILLSDRIYIMGEKPGRITNEFVIDIKKPRTHDVMLTEEFLGYKREIISLIG